MLCVHIQHLDFFLQRPRKLIVPLDESVKNNCSSLLFVFFFVCAYRTHCLSSFLICGSFDLHFRTPTSPKKRKSTVSMCAWRIQKRSALRGTIVSYRIVEGNNHFTRAYYMFMTHLLSCLLVAHVKMCHELFKRVPRTLEYAVIQNSIMHATNSAMYATNCPICATNWPMCAHDAFKTSIICATNSLICATNFQRCGMFSVWATWRRYTEVIQISFICMTYVSHTHPRTWYISNIRMCTYIRIIFLFL